MAEKNTILYEDRHIIICTKPVGVLSEEGGMPELLKELSGAKEIFCLHRLDRAVGGIMVYGKTKAAAGKLSGAISRGELEKHYLAVVQGRPAETSGEFRDLLFKDSAKNKSYVVKRMRKGVKEARLEYKTLDSRDGLSLVKIRLHTGRSHQIRVQFSSRGMPLAGDVKYGSIYRDMGIALWSERLCFKHPISGKNMDFSAAMPQGEPWDRFERTEEYGKNI